VSYQKWREIWKNNPSRKRKGGKAGGKLCNSTRASKEGKNQGEKKNESYQGTLCTAVPRRMQRESEVSKNQEKLIRETRTRRGEGRIKDQGGS